MTEFYSSNQNILAILLIVAFILSIVSLIIAITVVMITKKLRATTKILFAGKNGADLEEIIVHNNKRLREFDTEIQELFDISNVINKHANKSLNKIGIVRFNPFGEHAGNQSFAIAILNSNDDGLTLSSMQLREGTRIYTKQIEKGRPTNNELTEEEQAAITNAQ